MLRKFAEAVGLWRTNFLLIAPIVVTVWLPGNLRGSIGPESLWELFPETFKVGIGGLLLLDSVCLGNDLPSPRIEGVV